MSQLLLRRISKLSLTKQSISCCFSTATTSRSKPYLHLGSEIKDNVLNFNLYDPTGNKEVVKNLKIQDQSETLRNLFQESRTIGSSRGYLALRKKKDSSVYLVDISNQLKPKIISLPPLHFDKRETHVNVSVSSPVNGDVIVAVKFCGSRLSLCRVGDSEWTRIDVPCPYFESSNVIYSERDERFYLSSCNPDYTGPIDFTPKSGLVTPVSGYLKFPMSNMKEFFGSFSPIPTFKEFFLFNFLVTISKEFKKDDPAFSSFSIFKGSRKDSPYLSNFRVEQQLVESPSGQSFIVCQCIGYFNKKGEIAYWDDNPDITEKTDKIIVFKQDEEQEISPYTNDIGDLCIFIGANEAFCVSASDYPGLKPNSVYFAGRGSDFGVCDLSSQTILHLSDDSPQPYRRMFWIPPTPTLAS